LGLFITWIELGNAIL